MQASIRQIGEKLKSLIADDAFFYSVLLLLVAIVSFGLGQRSVTVNPANEAASVVTSAPNREVDLRLVPETPIQEENSKNTQAGTLIASKSGTKYHLPTCPGAKQIKEANKIEFSSKAEAEAAGYTAAANCPGLQ